MSKYNYKVTTTDGEKFKCKRMEPGSGEVWFSGVWYNQDDRDLEFTEIEHIEVYKLVPKQEINGFANALAAGTNDKAKDVKDAAKDILTDEKQHALERIN